MEKYEIIKQIGHGRYGQVWLVKCFNRKKQYVLKQINLQHASKREQRAAHLEAKLLSTLKHPNIVSYLDSFYSSDGSLFIVMGNCECGDLYTFIRSRNGIFFEERQIIDWFVQICLALKYLHDQNILHRDLKTQNIFLTRSKLIKVGDFGIARVLNSAKDMATTLIGTPYYMSPEIFCNIPYNHKSDVWALGCCIYEIATLKHAFNARDINSLMQKVLNGKVSSMPGCYSLDFLEVVSSMLAHDPEERPSVTEILLTAYIRKHILMFLEETKNSAKFPNQSSSKHDPSLNNVLEKSVEIVTAVSKEVMGPKTQPDKLCSMNSSNFLSCDYKESQSSTEAAKSVPDINGNGDGNDNSQRRNIICKAKSANVCVQDYKNEDMLDKSSIVYNKSHFVDSVESLPFVVKKTNDIFESRSIKPLFCAKDSPQNCCKENIEPQVIRNSIQDANNFSTADSNNHLKCVKTPLIKSPCSDKSTLKKQKTNGQASLQFLSNLTYTIKNARSTYFDNMNAVLDIDSDGKLSADVLSLPDLIGSQYFQVKESILKAHLLKSDARHKRRHVLNAKQNYDITGSQTCHISDAVRYPKISTDEYKSIKSPQIPKMNRCYYSSLQNSDLYQDLTKENLDPILPYDGVLFPVLKANIVDKCATEASIDGCLLQQIIKCNIKPCPANSAARQRRREKLDLESKRVLTKSVPISLDIFPVRSDHGLFAGGSDYKALL